MKYLKYIRWYLIISFALTLVSVPINIKDGETYGVYGIWMIVDAVVVLAYLYLEYRLNEGGERYD